MRMLHDLDGQEVNEVLRPDLQRIYEDEPQDVALPETSDLNDIIPFIFGGRCW